MGTHYFVAVKGEWADEPSELVKALRADLPELKVTRTGVGDTMAYDLELEGELGWLHADGRCISSKNGRRLVVRLAAWWRARVPPWAELAVFDDSTVTPVYVEPGMTADDVLARIAAVEAEWAP